MPDLSTTPPGWYPDPQGLPQQRYWDGAAWTGHTAPLPLLPTGTGEAAGYAPPPAAPGVVKSGRRLPAWAWVLIAVAGVAIGVILSPIFAVISLVVLITGIVALVKNTPTWLRFRNRKVATWVTAVSAVTLLMTGSIANAVVGPRDEPAPARFADLVSASPQPAESATRAPTPTPPPSPTPRPEETVAELVSVTDGDTIVTSVGKVRLIGIDAPEDGAWGHAQATAELTAFLGSAPLTLVAVDGRDDVDQYGRLLRYVRVDDKDAGAHLIGSGWASAKYDGRDGYGAHPLQAEYVELDASRAMPAEPAPVAPAPVESAPAPAPVAPVPVPVAPPAATTDPQFGTCREANSNGYGPYQSGVDPEYNWYQDRDGDGWVCE